MARIKKIFRDLKCRWQRATCKYPYRIQCNICYWQGRCFIDDSWHPHTVCPQCNSQVRHRLFFSAITSLKGLHSKDIIQDKKILHFAPEIIISRFLKKLSRQYVSADIERNDVDLKIDMCNMHTIADASFDLVVGCDVLEHVHSDSDALCEIYRILTDDGQVILTVPQQDNLPAKKEDSTITTPEGRKNIFGRHDHLRIYGNDFADFLMSFGFTVRTVDANNFSFEVVRKNILFPPKLSNRPLATNHRKLYFGKKMITS